MGQVEMNEVSMMCTLPSADADWQTATRQTIGNVSQLLAALLAAEAAVKSSGVAVLEIHSDFALDASNIQGAPLPFKVSGGHTLALVGGEWLGSHACGFTRVAGKRTVCNTQPAPLLASTSAWMWRLEPQAANRVQPWTCLALTSFWFWSRVLSLCWLTSA